jgi:hypothetical protein
MQYLKAKRKSSQRKENTMKRTLTTLGILMATGTPALASGGPETAETSLFVILFLGFGAVVILGQLIPAVTLFITTLRALFGKAAGETRPVTGR